MSYRSFSGVFRSKEKGLLAAFLYTLSIYRLIDLYTRAALGEGMAMIFLPLVMWGMYELFLGNEKKWYLAALGFTGVMQCHILSTELAVCFGGLFGLLYIGRLREKGRFRALSCGGGQYGASKSGADAADSAAQRVSVPCIFGGEYLELVDDHAAEAF